MSKKQPAQPLFVPADEQPEVLTTPEETPDRSALGREMKIGLGVILVLLVVLGAVLFRKLSGGQDVAATTGKQAAEPSAASNAGGSGPLITLPSQPTVMTATADSSVKPASGTLDSWAIAADAAPMGTAEAAAPAPAPSPPSFMPKPVAAEPSPHYAGYAAPEPGSEAPAWQPSSADRSAGAAGADPFLQQSAAPVVAGEAMGLAGQMPASQAAEAGFAPAWQAQPANAGKSEANPLRTQAGAEAGDASAEPPALPETNTMPPVSSPNGSLGGSAALVHTPSDAAPSPLPAYGSGYSRSTYRESQPMTTTAMPMATHNTAVAGAPIQSMVSSDNGTYTIQPGDNYWLISERLYGTGAYFQALAEHNRTKFPQENKLVVGETIAVASAEQLTAKYPSLCPKPGHRDAAQQRAQIVSTSTRLGGGKVYVVQQGDSLFDIARFELGKASRWVEIYELNRDVLGRQFDYLTPGMQLVLPADRPAGTVTQRSDQIYQR